MIKPCGNPKCKQQIEGNSKKKYCSHKCKKAAENAKKGFSKHSSEKITVVRHESPQEVISRPTDLNPIAAAYWDKLSPILIKRGHLNILSEDAFAELCDLHSRLTDIRKMIDAGTVIECEGCGAMVNIPGNRSLLQLDDKWSANDGTQTQTFKESALSDLKRKYSARFLDYCKQFYLTPAANRGNFGLDDDREKMKENGPDKIFD